MTPKFRAWDKEHDEMVFPDDTDKIYFEITTEGIVTYDMNLIFPDGSFTCLDAVVMQSTGLTDKNGVEIFQGDYILCKQYLGGNFVEYASERGYVDFKFGAFGLHRKQGFYRPFKDWLEDYEFEIVGNIYENPELLKFR